MADTRFRKEGPMRRYRLSLFFLLLMSGSVALAQDIIRDRGVALYLDQDMFVPLFNQDRDYTMGVALEFFDQAGGVYWLEDGLGWLAHQFGVGRVNEQSTRSFIIGSIAYTPDDIGNPAPIFDDRPYASLIYLGNKRVRADDEAALGVELQVGLLGTPIAREVQSTLHQWYREAADSLEPVEPRGWDHQISDGGEPTARLRVAWADRLAHDQGRWDLATTWDVSLGYQTNVSAGLSARWGAPGSPFWTLPFDPINRGNFLPSLSGDEWYVWGAYRLRAVGYDVLLQGQFRDSDVTFSADDLERLVHEAGVGITWAWRPVQLTLSLNAKTPELKSGVTATHRTHVWGGIYSMLRF